MEHTAGPGTKKHVHWGQKKHKRHKENDTWDNIKMTHGTKKTFGTKEKMTNETKKHGTKQKYQDREKGPRGVGSPDRGGAVRRVGGAKTQKKVEGPKGGSPKCKTSTHVSYLQISILTLNFNTSFVGNLTNVASLWSISRRPCFPSSLLNAVSHVWLGSHQTLHVGGSFLTRTHVFLVKVCCSPGSHEVSRVLGIVAVWSTAVDIC